jgi:hypothetical protein
MRAFTEPTVAPSKTFETAFRRSQEDAVMNLYEGMNPNDRFQMALDVQSGGNMRAIARAFVAVVDAAMADLQDTKAVCRDPAVVLFVNKLESLSQSERVGAFSIAYEECRKRAGVDA